MDKLVSGLSNLGNTCYMNAALQCLQATYPLSGYLLKKKYEKSLTENKKRILGEKIRKQNNLQTSDPVTIERSNFDIEYNTSVTFQLHKLINAMWSEGQEIGPKTFKKIIGYHNQIFKGYDQNDSQEFLSCVLDLIHEELKTEMVAKINFPKNLDELYKHMQSLEERKELNELLELRKAHHSETTYIDSIRYLQKHISHEHSIITDLFMGLYYTEVKCLSCETISQSFNPFYILSLPISDDASLEKCIAEFSLEEKLEDKNQYRCSKCNILVDALKKTTIWKMPEILIIQLKRFLVVTDRGRTGMKKINSLISTPENLLLENYSQNINYNLYGLVQHTGSLKGGHYVSCTKNPFNHKWYHNNDSRVNEINDISKEINTPDNYIMFYMNSELSV